MLGFNLFLRDAGLNPATIKVIRHKDPRAKRGCTPYDLWRAKDGRLELYQSMQSKDCFKDATHIASFVATPANDTLFVGIYSVDGVGTVPSGTRDPVNDSDVSGMRLYELTKCHQLAEYEGRLFIDWGPNPRQWFQNANNQDKAVVEISSQVEEPRFPGFIEFPPTTFESLAALPDSWKTALGAAKGVYVAVDTKAGKIYVGSACGPEGFWGRWQDYLQTGHGGNEAMKLDTEAEYQVSIVEVAGSSADEPDIIALENRWKEKLRSRDHGNLNWPEKQRAGLLIQRGSVNAVPYITATSTTASIS